MRRQANQETGETKPEKAVRCAAPPSQADRKLVAHPGKKPLLPRKRWYKRPRRPAPDLASYSAGSRIFLLMVLCINAYFSSNVFSNRSQATHMGSFFFQ